MFMYVHVHVGMYVCMSEQLILKVATYLKESRHGDMGGLGDKKEKG